MQSKESRSKGAGFGLPPGRGLSMNLLCSTYFWSVGKTKTQYRSSVILNRHRLDSLVHRVTSDGPSLQYSNIPSLLETVTGRANYL
jgi:hypothetical protein